MYYDESNRGKIQFPERANQEIDFSGNLNVDYCAGTSSLYYIYYPDEDLVVTGTTIA